MRIEKNQGLGTVAHELKHAYQFETSELALTIGRVFHPSYDKIDELEAISRGKLFGASDGYINPSLLIERVKVIDLSPYKGALNSPVLLQKKTCCGIFKNTAYRINGITYFNTIFNTVDQ